MRFSSVGAVRGAQARQRAASSNDRALEFGHFLDEKSRKCDVFSGIPLLT